MTVQNDQPTDDAEAQKKALDSRLETIGWGLFIIMLGGLWLVPSKDIPEKTWLFGAGIILLGLNGVRYLYGLKMSRFTVVLGILALASGICGFYGRKLPFFPILIILIGASIILKPLVLKGRSCLDFCRGVKAKDDDDEECCP